MQLHSLQRWSIVLLLITRLVLGEFAHAMPHQGESNSVQAPAAELAQGMPCPDHAGTSGAGELSTDSEDLTSKSHDPASHDTHCCQTSCDCPCLHLSALATSNVIAGVATLEKHLIPAAQPGHTPDRIFLLFRPPA